MNKAEKSIYDQIVQRFGTTAISISEVTTELGNDAAKFLRRVGTRVEVGVYSMTEVNAVVEEEVKTEKADYSSKVTDFFHTDNLVPSVDPTYVEFGCYQPVYTIVKSNTFLPFYITGESGNGKTLGVEQACAKAKRELVCCNVTNETSEEDLMGSFILENGDMIWKDGPVLVAMRRGAVLLLDELDQATTNIMCLQTVLQNKPYYVKKTNEMVYPKEGFTVIGTANTKGNGEGSDRFAGANVLNEAFLERFNAVYEQDYPPAKVEIKILQQLISNENKILVDLVRWASLVRENYKNDNIERCITTRRLVQIVKNYQVFKNLNMAITFATSRFDKATSDAMMDYYNTLNNTRFNDGLEKLIGEPAEAPTVVPKKVANGDVNVVKAAPVIPTPAQTGSASASTGATKKDQIVEATRKFMEEMNKGAYTSSNKFGWDNEYSNSNSFEKQPNESQTDYVKRLKKLYA